MKKLIFFLTSLLTTSLFAQEEVIGKSFETFHWEIQSMTWDESQQKYNYTVIEDIYSDYGYKWNVILYDDGTGEVNTEDPVGEISVFNVRQWKIDYINDIPGIVGKYTNESDGKGGTIFLPDYEGIFAIEFFNPQDGDHVVFDNRKSKY